MALWFQKIRMSNWIAISFLFISMCLATTASSNQRIVPENLHYEVTFFEDKQANTTIQEIINSPIKDNFQPLNENGLSFGWVDHPHWIKIDLTQDYEAQRLFMEIDYPLLDKIDVFIVDSFNEVTSQFEMGDHKPFEERPIYDVNFIIPVNFHFEDIQYIYIRAETTSSLQLPIYFMSESTYLKHRSNTLSVQGVFYGILIVMLAYNFFIFLSSRRMAYLHYVCFVTSFLILNLGLKGAGFQYFWPNSPWINDYAIATGGALSLIFLLLFARSFLALKCVPVIYKSINTAIFIGFLFLIGSFTVPYKLIVAPLSLAVIFSAIFVIGISCYRYINGYHEARFYLLAWIAMVSGSCTYLLKLLGVLPINFLTDYSMQIGSALEMVLLSLALADRINTLRKRLEENNQKLEVKVEERTKKLETALDQLGEANKKLELISTTDGLTGVRNRYFFDTAIDQAITKVNELESSLSLLMLDIDYFKKVNDQWGHIIGDKALQFIAGCLNQEIQRKSDYICRYGGEEFSVILPDANLQQATLIAEKIRLRIANTAFVVNGTKIPITISIGVASAEHLDCVGTYSLIQSTDAALYQSKHRGRNRVCCHGPHSNIVNSSEILPANDENPPIGKMAN